MATCPDCNKRDLVAVQYGPQTLLLEPHHRCYVAIEPRALFAADGDTVVLSAALVEHAPLCAGTQRQQARERAAGKEQWQRRQAQKQGRG